MKIFRMILGFMKNDDNSMRLDAVSRRLHEDLGDLRYKTIADSKREMHGDMMRLRGDFHKAIKKASKEWDEKQNKTD